MYYQRKTEIHNQNDFFIDFSYAIADDTDIYISYYAEYPRLYLKII